MHHPGYSVRPPSSTRGTVLIEIGQYRELGVLLWRGWGLKAIMNQCFGNHMDMASKGRQMPVVRDLCI